jgi:replication factor A1
MLSNGAINNLLRISSTNVLDTIVDYNLQIISLNLQAKQNNIKKELELYTCALGDTKYSYYGFILPVKKDKQNPNTGDIIKVSKISTSKLTYNGCKIIIVKNYEILKKSEEINNNLIQVESYDDIQKKISLENQKEKKKEEVNNTPKIMTNNNNNSNNEDNKKQEKKKIEVEYKIINPDDIDMKTILDLSQISTFTKNICLYVKLTRKSFPRKFYNKTIDKEARLLTFDLIDKNGFQMQAAIFDDTIEKFSPVLKEGNIYYIKGGYAKFNDKRYTSIKTDYKLIFDFKTQIMEVDKNLDKIFDKKDEKIEITKFENLTSSTINKCVNCLGYVLQISPPTKKHTYKGDSLLRKLVLCDSSMFKVQLTLWNKFTELDLNKGNILLLKCIKVCNYNNNIYLGSVDNSVIEINPDLCNENYNEYDELKKAINEGLKEEDIKYINEYNSANSPMEIEDDRSLANNKIIYISNLVQQLRNKYNYRMNSNKNENVINKEISMIFTIKATVLEFEHSDKNYYFACPKCKKKLLQKEEKYFCQNCECQITDPKLTYFLTLRVIDITGEHSLNLFGDIVNNLFGMDVKDYSNLIENKDYKKLEKITNNIEYHSFYFNGKATIHKYGTRINPQLVVHYFEREDFKKEKNRIFRDIKNILNING